MICPALQSPSGSSSRPGAYLWTPCLIIYVLFVPYDHLLKAGVIDPTKVARIALENAASIAGMFLTTECVVSELPEETPPMPPMGGGAPGMGGMM